MSNNNLDEYIDICIGSNGSHYDVAKVIYELIKHKFIYCGKNIWKYNDNTNNNTNVNTNVNVNVNDNINDNYIIDDKQTKLKQELKSTIINNFIMRSNYWDDKASIENDINISLNYRFKSSSLLKIAHKLTDDKYIICIIKELKQFFNTIIDD
jgi:hypothetical protein